MNAILDIFVVILFVVCVYMGYKNGFVKMIMGIASFIASFVIARIFSPELSEFIYERYIKPTFVNKIIEDLTAVIGKSTENLDINKLLTEGPREFEKIITSYGSNVDEVQTWVDNAADSGTAGINNFVANNLAEPLAKNISYFIAFAGIFFIVMILCGIITFVLNGIVKLPVLNLFNRLGGTLLGILYGTTWAYIIVFLVSLALPYCASQGWIASSSEVINNTTVFKWFYENMPFDL